MEVGVYPIPFRTRKSSQPSPMILQGSLWGSRSLPRFISKSPLAIKLTGFFCLYSSTCFSTGDKSRGEAEEPPQGARFGLRRHAASQTILWNQKVLMLVERSLVDFFVFLFLSLHLSQSLFLSLPYSAYQLLLFSLFLLVVSYDWVESIWVNHFLLVHEIQKKAAYIEY